VTVSVTGKDRRGQRAGAPPPRDYVGYGPTAPPVSWPSRASVALNIVVNYEEGSETSYPAGDNRNEGLGELPGSSMKLGYRDLAVESVYEYGSRSGIWRLLRMFDEYQLRVTFFASAVALARNPAVGHRIAEAGHEACAHGWRWNESWTLTRDQERQQIAWAIESIRQTCGERPLGWYCRYGPSVHTRELLVDEGGFVYDSDAYNDDLPYFVTVAGTRHLVVPYSLATNDGGFVRPVGFARPSDYFDRQRRALDELRREGAAGRAKMMSVGLHPRWVGQAARASALRDFIEYALGADDVWIARRIDIAQWWLAHHHRLDLVPPD
jgi:peptidoglycan/xylan/chitin deacetylase (PgdA/CDA1 family)